MNGSRSTDEWQGATPDTAIPPRVRLRVFDRADGLCQICTRKISAGDRWVADHIVAIINGGANTEGNLQLCCDWCDRKVKTPADVAEKSRIARIRTKALGIKKRSTFACSRDSKFRKKLDGSVVLR